MQRSDFPPDFIFGVATSAYQIEGAWREGGRGESIWDRFAHTPGKVKLGHTGDVACDHYYRYGEDLALVRGLGLDAYQLSIAWPRVVPDGRGPMNPAGLDFYDRLIDTVLANGLQPWVKLFHWDLPQQLEDLGGWTQRDTAFAMAEYADVVARRLGDRVAAWISHDEPWCIALLSYQIGLFAPGLTSWKAGLAAAHHVLLAHGLSLQAVRAHSSRPAGIALNLSPAYPASSSPEDVAAAARYDGYFNRWFLDPLAGRGYPADMLAVYEGYLPEVLDGDLATIAVPNDFLGVNYYNRAVMADAPDDVPLRAVGFEPGGQARTADREIYPEGMYDTLVRVSGEYPEFPVLYVTETGACFDDVLEGDAVHDPGRIAFYDAHIAQVARAMAQGARVAGLFIWSLLDNFEWSEGYTKRYGMHYVDYATQRRIPKDSAKWLKANFGR